MQVLQGMDPDKMVIILPSALIAMYAVITLQKSLSGRKGPVPGVVIPALCFIISTVLAVRPLIVSNGDMADGLAAYCLRMWLTFNIATIVFLFPYIITRRRMKELEKLTVSGQNSEGLSDNTNTEN